MISNNLQFNLLRMRHSNQCYVNTCFLIAYINIKVKVNVINIALITLMRLAAIAQDISLTA